ncbi:SMI1/KNR4 family protein [Tritonibacter litoralis]|nr:SMI1/KNR4 family protein [Tritonibacter litoralis]
MTDIFIYPRRDVPLADPSERAARVAAFEQAQGQQVSEPYRSFMLRYGGGFPWPNDLPLAYPATKAAYGEDPAVLFELYDWTQVEAHAKGEIYGDATPRDVLFIGDAEGGFQIVMSLMPDTRGAIYMWPHTSYPWGLAENDASRFLPLAKDFADMLDRIIEAPDSAVGRRVWENAKQQASAVQLVL